MSHTCGPRMRSNQGDHLQLLKVNKPRTHTVINVMRVVGDFIGQVTQLRFERGRRFVDEARANVVGTHHLKSLGIA